MPKGILESMLSGEGIIVPHVQPMYRLSDNRLMAREYLARHIDADGRAHAVGPLLQDPALSPTDRLLLDLKFLESTFQTLTRTGDASYLHFVNLEPVSLEAPGFWESLPRWLEALPFAAERVVMEFTESQGVHDLEALQGYANRLRDLGLQVAVDDLGAGVASLTHMARLAPDFIKADRSLVEQVHRRPYQAALLNALSHFAERMCIGFIAEGIETLEELQAILDADVPWGQGYVLGQPWPTQPRPLVGSIAASES
ncbi:EAL domain-containing protein [Geothrix sp. PMB-07]|uniref:EAL domain-containing protein n=1 Tax=Geothrix sp. PMB-07 TaxID=3068640 RepID=UPI002740FB0D|nr:EAL domain-containing protein [Geothrix sp. PMB-07]WLT30194.1 EAL domain-containing protein [Geothrix sp. PMB-07]